MRVPQSWISGWNAADIKPGQWFVTLHQVYDVMDDEAFLEARLCLWNLPPTCSPPDGWRNIGYLTPAGYLFCEDHKFVGGVTLDEAK